MVMTVHCDVVSAEESIFSGLVEIAVFPGEAGELGILPKHTPLLTRIKPGTIRLKVPDQSEFELVYVSGGMLEVQPDMITVLADTAIRAHDLDEAKALEAKKRAEEAEGRAAHNETAAIEESHRALAAQRRMTELALLLDQRLEAPLADADREGKQYLATGTGITLPIVFTADKLVKTFAPKSDVHERIEAASDGQLLRFYRLKPVYECTQKDGKAMRSFAAEILGPKAPALIAAVRQVDKFGVPKSDIKLEWSAALAEAGE